jgi:hypothetical protein
MGLVDFFVFGGALLDVMRSAEHTDVMQSASCLKLTADSAFKRC